MIHYLHIYSFYLVESLSRLIKKVESETRPSGIKLAKNAPGITHLMFADDILIFGRGDANEAKKLMDALTKFESCSRQKINLDKSHIIRPNAILASLKRYFLNCFNMQLMPNGFVYL